MAVIGESLPLPENGWKRFDNTYSTIIYKGPWESAILSGFYNSTTTWVHPNGSESVEFFFYGTKLRILSNMNPSCSGNIRITIDGNEYFYNQYSLKDSGSILLYEKSGLESYIHTVKINVDMSAPSLNVSGTRVLGLDCIDIDDNGYLISYISYKLNQKTLLQDMEIGDIIPCRYTAPTSGKLGYFSELGTCEADFINPEVSSATPDGKFYFVKVSDDKLIADRNIQHSITWSELNDNGIVEGINKIKYFKLNGINSYISIPMSKIKTSTVSIRIKVKNMIGKGNNITQCIYSCTNSGGYNIEYNSNTGVCNVLFAIGTTTYTTAQLLLDRDYSGVRSISACFDGTKISAKVVDEETGNIVESYTEKNGSITYGTANNLLIGAEAGTSTPESSYYAKFDLLEFVLSDRKNIIESDELINENNTLIYYKRELFTKNILYDLGTSKTNALVYNCEIEYDLISNILTLPTGGVAYSDIGEEVFPISGLTSDEGDDYKITASSYHSDTVKPINAFNKTSINTDDCWHSGAETNPWLKIDLKHNPKIVSGFKIKNRTAPTWVQPPLSCEVLGSNDDILYTSLFTTATPSGSAKMSSYVFDNINPYRYYKFQFTSSSSGYTAVDELILYDTFSYDNIKEFSYSNLKNGGWPITNDWDKYVWKSDLDGKINPSDNGIWNYSKIGSICKERLISGVTETNSVSTPIVAGGTKVSLRGYVDGGIDDTSAKRFNYCCSATAATQRGFRPMLILKEGE